MSLTKEEREVYYNKLLKKSLRRHAHNIRKKDPLIKKEEKNVNWQKLNTFLANKILNAAHETNFSD